MAMKVYLKNNDSYIYSETAYLEEYDRVLQSYYRSTEIFQVFLDKIGNNYNPDTVMDDFWNYCGEKTDDEMCATWEEVTVRDRVVGA